MQQRTVSNSYIKALLRCMQAQQVTPMDVLAGLPVSEQAIDNATGRMSAEAAHIIWQRCLQLTGDAALGLKLASDMKAGTFRMLGLAAMHADTLYASLNVLLRYHRLISEVGSFSVHQLSPSTTAIIYTILPLPFQLLPQQVEAIVGSIYLQACQLLDRRVQLQQLRFSHAAQADMAAYVDVFGIQPEFSAQEHALYFSHHDLQSRLPHADSELFQLHCNMAEQQLKLLPDNAFTSSVATQWLSSSMLQGQLASIQQLARHSGMSVRTLQRTLKQEGTTWTAVVDQARCNTLQQLLRQGLTLDVAAQRMGYHDASSLSRAALRWFGKTAGQWRGDLLQGDRPENSPADNL